MQFVDALEPRQLFAGQPDPSFGGDGSVDLKINAHAYSVRATGVTVDDAGRTVAAGLYPAKGILSLSRLKKDGSVDKSFGTNGIATIALPKGYAANDSGQMKLRADHAGRILVLDLKHLFRITETGRLDRKFGTGGMLTVPILRTAHDVVVDRRNRPILSGITPGKTGDRGAVVRLGERGALDTGFGSGGAYKTPVPQDPVAKVPGTASVSRITMLESGKLLGAASLFYAGDPIRGGRDSALAAFRLNADGSLDATYGNKGTTTVARQADAKGRDVVASVFLGAFTPGGGLITDNNVYSDPNGEPDPNRLTIEHDFTQIDADGKVVRDAFTLPTPANAPKPPTNVNVPTSMTNHIAAAGDDGSLLLTYGTTLYRVTAKRKVDASFAPIATGLRRPIVDGGRLLLYATASSGNYSYRSPITVDAYTL